ncbi:hypothetical protein P3X46_014490 [Hevea brasiliensis]|uniref:Uncharacterized protein n=1 Tax=Hevea brasiliensis TaxID=3981 RepID=A0ABQ9M6U3_HEVBR|nr:hypothetical protein P3X46_014490 [Hevea brasiliensis]
MVPLCLLQSPETNRYLKIKQNSKAKQKMRAKPVCHSFRKVPALIDLCLRHHNQLTFWKESVEEISMGHCSGEGS